VNTWSSISTRKKMVRSGTLTTTKSAILAGSPIIGLPAFSMTIGIAWIMRLTHSQQRSHLQKSSGILAQNEQELGRIVC